MNKINQERLENLNELYDFIASECLLGLYSSDAKEHNRFSRIQNASYELLLRITINFMKAEKETDKEKVSELYAGAKCMATLMHGIHRILNGIQSSETKEENIINLLKEKNFDIDELLKLPPLPN